MNNKKNQAIILSFIIILIYSSYSLYYYMINQNTMGVVVSLCFMLFLGCSFIIGSIDWELKRRLDEFNGKIINKPQGQEQLHLAISMDHLQHSVKRITRGLLLITGILFLATLKQSIL